MRPAMFGPSAQPRSGRYLSLPEREEIALLRAQGCTIREMGRRIQRAASTVSRELRRNAATRSGGMTYRATTAQWHAERSACRPKQAKLMWNKALHSYVQDRLSGIIMTPNVFRLPARPYHGTDEGTVGGSIAAGRAPGALSRSPVDCRSIFQMTRPCALAMKRSIKPCLFKAKAHYVAS